MPDIRLLESAEHLTQAATLFRSAMVGLPFPPVEPDDLPLLFEPGRTYGAFHDGQLVGTTDSYSGGLTIPGGSILPQAAVTHVGVLPTHTRRGLSRALAHRQLSDARARGEIVANLRASDARIYGNFGYGIASQSATFEVDRESAVPWRKLPAGSVRLLAADDAWPTLERIYADHRPDRPGTIDRTRYWWDFQRYKRGLFRGVAHVAVHGPAGAEDGFVRYHPIGTDEWFVSRQRTIVVDDFMAKNSDAWLGLIGYLLSVDLVHRIVFANRPIDDPLQWLFRDHRSVRLTGIRDETWLRLVDVEQALAARTYSSDDTVVLEVTDELLPQNCGAIRLSAKGAEATNQTAQAKIDVGALASVYLGGTRWWQLAKAGRVVVSGPDVVKRLDALFAIDHSPHSGTVF